MTKCLVCCGPSVTWRQSPPELGGTVVPGGGGGAMDKWGGEGKAEYCVFRVQPQGFTTTAIEFNKYGCTIDEVSLVRVPIPLALNVCMNFS